MKTPKGIIKVRCECGDEILLVPDLKKTGKAIEDHVDLHLQSLRAPTCTAAEAGRLKDALIAQILTITGLLEDEKNR